VGHLLKPRWRRLIRAMHRKMRTVIGTPHKETLTVMVDSQHEFATTLRAFQGPEVCLGAMRMQDVTNFVILSIQQVVVIIRIHIYLLGIASLMKVPSGAINPLLCCFG
jgi:hypothetical protein